MEIEIEISEEGKMKEGMKDMKEKIKEKILVSASIGIEGIASLVINNVDMCMKNRLNASSKTDVTKKKSVDISMLIWLKQMKVNIF